MELLGRLVAEDFHGPQPDLEVAIDLSAVEVRRHAGEFQFAVEWLV